MKSIGWVVMAGFAWLFLVSGCAAPPTARATLTPSESIPPAKSPAPSASPSAPQPGTAPTGLPADLFFDDFSYSSQAEMQANGWIIRELSGWPGVPGATFRAENVTFLDEAAPAGNRLLRMTSSTDGSSRGTFQTQICHRRKYLEGTYAARVNFHNGPAAGPDGDQVVEAFYAIVPYRQPLDPAYSEMDFEYLPNGGWGSEPMTMMFTTWETVRIEPWLADNVYGSAHEDQDGWQTLVLQVMDGQVRYYVGGKQIAEHGGDYYPDSPMSINFNLWFINGGLLDSRQPRSYQAEIDWVFHQKGALLTPEQVNRQVRLLRGSAVPFVDTVAEMSPPLESPCDL